MKCPLSPYFSDSPGDSNRGDKTDVSSISPLCTNLQFRHNTDHQACSNAPCLLGLSMCLVRGFVVWHLLNVRHVAKTPQINSEKVNIP